MSEEYNMGQLGVVAPFDAKEGTITMTDGATAHGNVKVPVLSAALKKGDSVTLTDEFQVAKASGTDLVIGIVYNTPKWEIEPVTDYTQAQAISAEMLREVGVETIFKKILTCPAKASEGIEAGKYLVNKAGTFELSASSGTTATSFIALTDQDSTANRVVVGFI